MERKLALLTMFGSFLVPLTIARRLSGKHDVTVMLWDRVTALEAQLADLRRQRPE